MSDHAVLLQALRNFATAMGGSYDINGMSIRLSERITEALGVEGAGVSVADQDGRLKFVAATSEKILEIERVQEEFQQGPCVIAFETQKPVTLESIESAPDWSAYRDVARRLGLKAVVGFPLGYENTRLGALNIYASVEREWSDDDLDVLGVFADMATAYLVRNTELAETKDLAKQLQSALDSRVIIEQAKGVLANEYAISVDEAFDRIRRHSQENNVKLSEVCAAIVETGFKPG